MIPCSPAPGPPAICGCVFYETPYVRPDSTPPRSHEFLALPTGCVPRGHEAAALPSVPGQCLMALTDAFLVPPLASSLSGQGLDNNHQRRGGNNLQRREVPASGVVSRRLSHQASGGVFPANASAAQAPGTCAEPHCPRLFCRLAPCFVGVSPEWRSRNRAHVGGDEDRHMAPASPPLKQGSTVESVLAMLGEDPCTRFGTVVCHLQSSEAMVDMHMPGRSPHLLRPPWCL